MKPLLRLYNPSLGAVVFLTFLNGISFAQVNVLTANYDNNRTNSNVQETTLNTQTVNPNTFGKIGTLSVDGEIYAQPLYVSGVPMATLGARNVVYVATMHNSVYAFDADAPQSNTPLWKVSLGTSVPSQVFAFSDIIPEVGILGTPVIDPANNVLYVVSNTLENNVPVFRLHALSLSDGSELMNGPVLITGSTVGNGPDSDENGVLTFDPSLCLQRPGLVLTRGGVYISFGSHADEGHFRGWLFGYNALNVQDQIAVFTTTPDGYGGSIWQSGRAPAVNADGSLMLATGNGDSDGQSTFGESMLHLSVPYALSKEAQPGVQILDWFTPSNWSDLNDDDWDFGSTGVILVPGQKLALSGGKSGTLYLAASESLGHLGADVNGTVQAAQVNQWGMFSMALWANDSGPTVYELEPANALRAFQIASGQINTTELSEYDTATLFAGIAVSANGSADGSGVVWLTTGDSASAGTLHALDAGNLANELWNSDMVPDRDTLGRSAKFVAPTVANGKVFTPTFSNSLAVFGLLTGTPSPAGPPQITSVTSDASFLGSSVAPGELVAISGANLGPVPLASLQLDANGNVSTSLAGTQVLFDGTPVPMLFVSATQVGAVVPFGLAATATQVQVVSQGSASASLTVPVIPAAPALFSMDGTGGGFGILNQDGTVNDWTDPAPIGSIVTMYATGIGLMNPASQDGTVSQAPLSAPVLPVSVFFNGQPGQITFVGAAPGMIAGVVQINAVVPAGVAGNYNVQVAIEAGTAMSTNALTLNVE